MPQLTDRAKLPNIVDPVIKNTMDPKHLYQVCDPGIQNSKLISHFYLYYQCCLLGTFLNQTNVIFFNGFCTL